MNMIHLLFVLFEKDATTHWIYIFAWEKNDETSYDAGSLLYSFNMFWGPFLEPGLLAWSFTGDIMR
jgi:hypothetical protein